MIMDAMLVSPSWEAALGLDKETKADFIRYRVYLETRLDPRKAMQACQSALNWEVAMRIVSQTSA